MSSTSPSLDSVRCSNCGETNIDRLEPMDNGLLYCASCDRVTNPASESRPRYEPPTRSRRDTDE